jgi:hypothetical protein
MVSFVVAQADPSATNPPTKADSGPTSVEPSSPPPSVKPSSPPPSVAWQSRVESRYREFESLLQRLSDLLRPTDPDRAALLGKALSESRQELIAPQLQEIVKKIERGELSEALEDQDQVLESMADLLELLLDENRSNDIKAERQRMQEQLQEAKRLSSEQRQLREKTQQLDEASKQSPTDLAKEQENLAQAAQDLAQKMKGSPESQSPPAKGQPNSDQKPSPDSSSSQADKMQAAEQAMRAAKDKLAELQKQDATREQDKAIEQLEKTIEELHQMLEQQREEERQELLARLEARLREIKQIQENVWKGTIDLDRRPPSQRTRTDEQRSVQLSRNENQVATGLDQVLAILIEDGTAVAFPETMEQLARDAESVEGSLARFQTGPDIQQIEKDIIDTLDEMIAALDKAKGKKSKESQSSSPAGGKSGRSPLVEQLAELKMIRSLQLRINERTETLEKKISGEGEQTDESRKAIEELADRQHRVYEITRDVAGGETP